MGYSISMMTYDLIILVYKVKIDYISKPHLKSKLYDRKSKPWLESKLWASSKPHNLI